MRIESAVRISLWLTAPLNLLVATAFAFPHGWLGSRLEFPPTHPFYALFSGALVGLFGAAYLWLALQPAIHRPLLAVGASGKAMAVLISVYLFTTGQLSGLTTALVSADLLFVVLWLSYLGNRSSYRQTPYQ